MKIVFDSDRASDWKQSLQKISREFRECELRLNAISNGLGMDATARGKIESRLDSLSRSARELHRGLSAMADFLASAETAYTDADRQMANELYRLVDQWRESERVLAPMLSRARMGLTIEDTEHIDAIRSLDGLFMNGTLMDFENHTAYFKPLDIKFEVLPDKIDN
jgi:DNA repair ATPase RecN